MVNAIRNPLAVLFLVSSALFLSAPYTFAKPLIEVTNVRFDRSVNDWVRVSVDIRPERNPLPEAKNPDFLDDVELKIYLAYELDDQEGKKAFSFYRSSVRIISIEQSRTYQIQFFMPGVVRDRDDLDFAPFSWLIELSVGGQLLPVSDDQFDTKSIQTKPTYDSLLSKANSEGIDNDGILVPIYLAPDYVVNEERINYRDVPAYYRFAAEK